MLPLLALACLASIGSVDAVVLRKHQSVAEKENPVTKVVKLLEEMKAQVEKEAKEDDEIYGKHDCWCKTNDAEKTEAIKVAEARIEELSAFIEQGTANAARLETEIDELKDEITANQDAVDKASAIREEEKEEFESDQAEMKEAVSALKGAIDVLSKVQLLQGKNGNQTLPEQSLVQVKRLVSRISRVATVLDANRPSGAYKSVMQKDLWDMLGAFSDGKDEDRVITGLNQEDQPTGAAAGATSYSAKSSTIFGILQTMLETFTKDLAKAQKEEFEAELAFQRLRAAKMGEMEAAGKAVEEKSAELADNNQKVAQAKQDIEDTKAALSADEIFLMDLKKRCATADSEYEERSKTRQEEIAAIAQTIQILMEDDARDLFSKTVSFLQTSSHQRRQRRLFGGTVLGQAQRSKAASDLLAVARRHGAEGWHLAMLAVGVQLDGFEKVKEMMDKMVVELKKQQEDEYQKHEACTKDIDSNEDDTMVKTSEKKDQTALITSLEGTMAKLEEELGELKTQVADAHVALKTAGENRKEENHEFQQTVADQRATVAILNKALDRLRAFYAPKASSLLAQGRQEPGAPAPPPPAMGNTYSKSGASGGVMQMIAKIIQDAEAADKEAVVAEQASQEAYSEFVTNTNEMLDAAEEAIATKTGEKAKAEGDKLIAEKDLKATEAELGSLADQNKALHLDCDYLLKNYDIRQQARQEEIEAIQEAKAILSGADFGDA